MPRKRSLDKSKRVEILLPHELLEKIDTEANKVQSTRSDVIRGILYAHYTKQSATSKNASGGYLIEIKESLDKMSGEISSIHARVKRISKIAKR
jgi:metal-responsive CopG/Arc/MetJ family transcriptional regulator